MDWFSSMKVNKYIHTLCTILFTHNFQFCLAGFSLLKPSTTKINRQTVLVRNANAIVLRPGTCCIVSVSYKSLGFIHRSRRCPTDLGNLSTFFICMFFIHELSTDALIRFQSRLRQWPSHSTRFAYWNSQNQQIKWLESALSRTSWVTPRNSKVQNRKCRNA